MCHFFGAENRHRCASSVISIRSEIRADKIAPSHPWDGDARFLVELALVRQRSGRRCAVQVATASASVRCIEQGDVESVSRVRTASATGDFQHVAMHRAAFVGADLMHDAVIAAAQALPAIPEIEVADSLQLVFSPPKSRREASLSASSFPDEDPTCVCNYFSSFATLITCL